MKLSIASLNESGAFAGAPVPRTVTWEQGGETLEAETWIRPLSYRAAVGDLEAINRESDRVAARIAWSVVDESGQPVFTPEDITGEADPDRGPLNAALTLALLSAISEVNGLGKPRS